MFSVIFKEAIVMNGISVATINCVLLNGVTIAGAKKVLFTTSHYGA